MGFGSLLGNDSLKEQLHHAFAGGRASHFYLISGPAGSGKGTLARLLAAAFLCEGRDRPCMTCAACRKVFSNVHPDITVVTDPDHKNVPVKQIRQVRDELFIRPNEGSHKLVILPQSLGIEGQNALLKVLEEPPSYGVFLLLTDNPETVLPTVRSRCVELKMQPLRREVLLPALQKEFPQAGAEALEAAFQGSGGYLGQARQWLSGGEEQSPYTEEFAQALCGNDALRMTQILAQMERLNRDQLTRQLLQWLEILEDALSCRAGMPARTVHGGRIAGAKSGSWLLCAMEALRQAMDYAQSNVSPGAICGHLAHVL